ncbi:transporter substrate-binding domain-containing protein [Mesorhizobium sp.]|uniref:transporter substrate-binding domain-containing protein n=1 Tax=Mesorhizobium sp. TaxID=1871066 RepID=UPI0012237AD5|nr:transporter substrate-binding domain-containing protein [Mesorhizobium sp.]TIL34602.1 MAG: transporter substrate-binding domain-containing protein [Mesorhizobium sp.]TIM48602.1 MAG: transporter substrate-binding domain-containing protein [Mesorhizobium sp.]
MKTLLRPITIGLGLALLFSSAPNVIAGELADGIAGGKTIRIGFATEPPFAYPGENNKPLGFVNAFALGVLHEMGYDKIEPVVTDWGGLVPGLQAGRLDIITGGMYIQRARCDNVTFADPMMKVVDGFIVKPGNPDKITTYRDIASKGATMVTGAGYSIIAIAKKEGVLGSQILEVPGPTEILAAVASGRAAVGVSSYMTMLDIAQKSGGKVEVTDPSSMPDWTHNWIGIAFRGSDKDFVEKFNAAQKRYMGSPEMMKAVGPYGYDEKLLPGDTTLEWVCANR